MHDHQLVPENLLSKTKSILFVTHLALGDFSFLQTYFNLFAQRYPHIALDIWINEDPQSWFSQLVYKKRDIKQQALYDWVSSCSFVRSLYKQTYLPHEFRRAQQHVAQHDYRLAVSLGVLRPYRYAHLARMLCPRAFIAGTQAPVRSIDVFKKRSYAMLDASVWFDRQMCAQAGMHINDVFASWFSNLFGLHITQEQKKPYIYVPEQWVKHEQEALAAVFAKKRISKKPYLVFINCFAKDKKRCWPLERVAEIIKQVQQTPQQHRTIFFIINAPPACHQDACLFFQQATFDNIMIFSAQKHFFQLPAMMSLVDLVISVETSTMHLASALSRPLVALMRKKNPEWRPWNKEKSRVIVAQRRDDWISNMPIDAVAAAALTMMKINDKRPVHEKQACS